MYSPRPAPWTPTVSHERYSEEQLTEINAFINAIKGKVNHMKALLSQGNTL